MEHNFYTVRDSSAFIYQNIKFTNICIRSLLKIISNYYYIGIYQMSDFQYMKCIKKEINFEK